MPMTGGGQLCPKAVAPIRQAHGGGLTIMAIGTVVLYLCLHAVHATVGTLSLILAWRCSGSAWE